MRWSPMAGSRSSLPRRPSHRLPPLWQQQQQGPRATDSPFTTRTWESSWNQQKLHDVFNNFNTSWYATVRISQIQVTDFLGRRLTNSCKNRASNFTLPPHSLEVVSSAVWNESLNKYHYCIPTLSYRRKKVKIIWNMRILLVRLMIIDLLHQQFD